MWHQGRINHSVVLASIQSKENLLLGRRHSKWIQQAMLTPILIWRVIPDHKCESFAGIERIAGVKKTNLKVILCSYSNAQLVIQEYSPRWVFT